MYISKVELQTLRDLFGIRRSLRSLKFIVTTIALHNVIYNTHRFDRAPTPRNDQEWVHECLVPIKKNPQRKTELDVALERPKTCFLS